MSLRGWVCRLVLAWAGAPLLGAGSLNGQAVRFTGATTVRYLELRPLVADSVAVEDTRGGGILRRGPDGQVVRCVTGAAFCAYLASGPTASTAPVSQDLTASAWGFGRGIRGYVHLRGRAVVGGEEALWPRADDTFEALAAYVEVDRSRIRVRAGRQWMASGLGFYNFDGATLELRPLPGVYLTAYGGRGLVRGVSEPRTGGALAAIEPFAPEEGDFLVGVVGEWRHGPPLTLSVQYQREVRTDRKGLHAERLAADGSWRRDRGELTASLEADLAGRTLDEIGLEATFRLDPATGVSALYRLHRPYFEAWTIWGAFDPVGYSELGGRGWWRPPGGPLGADLRVAWRTYDDTHASSSFGAFRGSGWRAVLSATAAPAPGWGVQARLGTDIGFGAARDEASLRVERRFDGRTHVGASVQAFQQAYEFRVDEGTVLGAGIDGGIRLTARARLDASVTAYRHHAGQSLPTPDWSQLRGSLTARWTVGTEPSAGGGGG